ncbi:helix-turn-helix transcriptional regulator [Micromonospora sp. DR5-3]|uniref:winged helix-turn-helix transcriptional regulator n=1 Tax=unclassified Micromonospora TaxID=2617518 RepID=UPI0011D3D37B|nr:MULTISPECIES: helix-turn-helix domain-containing protein [unclassified Micromonospora]MCW3818654.1 helix-turn-helix transcriptional regulator [Micromonospora sp. DR5-3]TYC21146.1 helix-turn-helix transcriptional regulator [Micromonospora sp. MP36]
MTTRPQVSAAAHACDAGLARAFAFLGKRWNGMLLGVLANGPAGFAELARALPGISESVLSDRLGELCRVGLVSRTVREGPPVGVSYQLTDPGAALLPALDALARWAHDHLPAEAGRAGGC